MPQPNPGPTSPLVRTAPGLSDYGLIERVRAGDAAAFELIMRHHSRRLFRLARSVLRNGTEAEDVVQETYVQGFAARRLQRAWGLLGLARADRLQTRRWTGCADEIAWSRSTTTSAIATEMPMSAVSRRRPHVTPTPSI